MFQDNGDRLCDVSSSGYKKEIGLSYFTKVSIYLPLLAIA